MIRRGAELSFDLLFCVSQSIIIHCIAFYLYGFLDIANEGLYLKIVSLRSGPVETIEIFAPKNSSIYSIYSFAFIANSS